MRINDAIRASKLGKGKIENALGKFGEKECWGHTRRLVRLFRTDRRQDGRAGNLGRSDEPLSVILARVRLRLDGRQPVRP